MIVGWLVVFYSLVLFLSSKYDTAVDIPTTRIPFFHLDSLVRQLYSFGPPLGRAVQTTSVSVTTSLSCSVPDGGDVR